MSLARKRWQLKIRTKTSDRQSQPPSPSLVLFVGLDSGKAKIETETARIHDKFMNPAAGPAPPLDYYPPARTNTACAQPLYYWPPKGQTASIVHELQ